MDVGDLISLYRKQAGLTIDELAEKSGVPKGTLNKITGGVTKAPTLPNMKAIARALGKTLADFDDLPKAEQPAPETGDRLSDAEEEFFTEFRRLPESHKGLAADLCTALVRELVKHQTIESKTEVSVPAVSDR